MEKEMLLYDLPYGVTAIIVGIASECQGDARRRLLDLGFVKGTDIKVQGKSPLGNPIAYNLRGTLIALRKQESSMVLIKIQE